MPMRTWITGLEEDSRLLSCSHVAQNRQRCAHGSDWIVLVRYRKTETDKQPISDIANNGAVKASYRVGACVAIAVNNISKIFLIELN